MKLSQSAMHQLLNTSMAAAYSAGARIMKHFYSNDAFESDSKGRIDLAEDVVTQADRDAQDIIFDFLLDSHPDVGMLSEEEEEKNHSRFDKPFFWSVDPLDGTLPFLEKTSGFAVSIGLVSQAGEPVMGVAYAPAVGDMYYALSGGAAYRNGSPIVTSDKGVFSLLFNRQELVQSDSISAYSHILRRIISSHGIDRISTTFDPGAVVKSCRVCDHKPSCYFGLPRTKSGCSLWDFAATACIAKQAGGWVSDLLGRPLALNNKETTFVQDSGFVFASGYEVAQEVMKAYDEWLKKSPLSG